MRKFLVAVVFGTGFALVGCGGGYGGTATSPDGSTGAPAGAVIINVVGQNGAQSFSPNPATVPAGTTVSWHNVDSIDHHVVLDGGGFDTGNISPGRYSAAMTLPNVGAYHCSLHPTMVGTLVRQ